MTGAHRDPVEIQQHADILRMRAVHDEGQHAALVACGPDQAQSWDLLERPRAVSQQRSLVRSDAVQAEVLDIVDRRRETDRGLDRWRAGFELVRDLVELRALV